MQQIQDNQVPGLKTGPLSYYEGSGPDNFHVSIGAPVRWLVGLFLAITVIIVFGTLFGPPNEWAWDEIFIFFVIIICVPFMASAVRVGAQWEKGVILRWGVYDRIKGPGIFLVVPGLETVLFVDIRLLTLEIPAQKAITKDNVPVQIDGALFFQVSDPAKALIEVQDYRMTTSQYAQAALRDVVGGLSLDELLAEREQIQSHIRDILEAIIFPLGIHVESVRLLDVDVPEDLKRMMSRQASAEREKRATITKAEGDRLAAINLADAAATMFNSPGAMQLRTLQSVDGLGSSASNTVLLLPIELIEYMSLGKEKRSPLHFQGRSGETPVTQTQKG